MLFYFGPRLTFSTWRYDSGQVAMLVPPALRMEEKLTAWPFIGRVQQKPGATVGRLRVPRRAVVVHGHDSTQVLCHASTSRLMLINQLQLLPENCLIDWVFLPE